MTGARGAAAASDEGATTGATTGAAGDATTGAAGGTSIRVLVADDQAMVRGALGALLGLERDIEVVAQAGDGDEAVAQALEHRPDVALVDIEMPGRDGIEVVRALARDLPSCRCLIVTTFGRPGYLRRAVEAGARGFVVKDTPSDRLAEAVRRIHAGLRVMDPQLAQESLVVGASPLTERESEVLRAALGGASVQEIAAALHLSPGTVRNHLSAAIGKTGTGNRTEAARVAQDRGWL